MSAHPTVYKIVVRNNSPEIQGFFFFTKPAKYVGGGHIYSNSIYHRRLRPYKEDGTTLDFVLEKQYYAGAEDPAEKIVVGQASGTEHAVQAIDLSPSQPNSTFLEIDPMGLKKATNGEGVEPGAFRINTPSFPTAANRFNIGLGVKTKDGSSTLANFVAAEPAKSLDCQPIVKFYVKTGRYVPGTVINFESESRGAAMCDATQGVDDFKVTYEDDGSWMVNGKKQPGVQP